MALSQGYAGHMISAALKAGQNMSASPLVQMRGITKRFPGVLANDRIDFRAYAGKLHALLGENGAGKTTLMKILYGVYQPDAGEICIDGHGIRVRSPREAIRLGIGMVFQHYTLIPSMTVVENIALSTAAWRLPLRSKTLASRLHEVAWRYRLHVEPEAPVWQLSVGEQQRVEILKLLNGSARILILDEPTAVLTPQEISDCLQTLRALAAAGHAVIFIMHKLDEVLRVVANPAPEEVSKLDLARYMVGRDILPSPKRVPIAAGEVVLSVTALSARNDQGWLAVKNASLEVRRGKPLASPVLPAMASAS
jgi:general nucleoside transport system ATP-binding protein